jgi:hypothetical protein
MLSALPDLVSYFMSFLFLRHCPPSNNLEQQQVAVFRMLALSHSHEPFLFASGIANAIP